MEKEEDWQRKRESKREREKEWEREKNIDREEERKRNIYIFKQVGISIFKWVYVSGILKINYQKSF